jgi:hypothetical protein
MAADQSEWNADFEQIESVVLNLQRLPRDNLVICLVGLRYWCHQRRKRQLIFAEIAVHSAQDEKPRRIQRAARKGAWQALEKLFDGYDIGQPNMFINADLSEAEEIGLQHDLALIQASQSLKHLESCLSRWLTKHDIPKEILAKMPPSRQL